MSKIALKVTRRILAIVDVVYDRVEQARVKALYGELKAITVRADKRHSAAVEDANLRRAVQAELALLENDDDQDSEA